MLKNTTQQRNILIVHNPAAGKGKSQKGLEQIIAYIKQEAIDYDILETEKEFTATQKKLAKKLNGNHSEIWISGGDGTLHQLVNCLPHEFWHLPIAVLPTGTGNDFVKNYMPTVSIEAGLQIALNSRPKPVDIWQCNDTLFIHGLGIGFDGQVVESMLKRKTLFKGFLAYYYHVLRLLLSYKEKEFILTANTKETVFACFMITVGNSHTFGGGFKITPKAKINDGMLDVCAISKVPVWLRPRYLKSVENGKHLHLSYVNYFNTDTLTIHTPHQVAGHIDGELFYSKQFKIVKHTKTLNVILP